ncbi:hypothetical protein C7W88_19105 (plasmid) [Novosphingobium sp. THN1]|nr:hypothetical protein C7W88_19105 [Novosphingobium sp. THN1]
MPMTDFDSSDETFLLSRRTMLGGAGLTGVALASSGLLGAAPALGASLIREEGIPTDPAARIAMIRRMRLRTDPGIVYWWFRGRNYAQQGAKLTPLCELVFGAVMQVNPLADGSMELTSYELGFRTAPGTNERSDQLRNPLTGEMVDVPFVPVGPTTVRYSAANDLIFDGKIGNTTLKAEHVPELFYHMGDQITFQQHTAADTETPGLSPRRLNDMTMITSPAREALDPRVHCASATGYGTDLSDYARWWKMPAGMGTQCLRSVGRKETDYANMPKDWVAMLARVNPEGARDPRKLLTLKQEEYRN